QVVLDFEFRLVSKCTKHSDFWPTPTPDCRIITTSGQDVAPFTITNDPDVIHWRSDDVDVVTILMKRIPAKSICATIDARTAVGKKVLEILRSLGGDSIFIKHSLSQSVRGVGQINREQLVTLSSSFFSSPPSSFFPRTMTLMLNGFKFVEGDYAPFLS
ncbi:hypothetical protein PENTCL1PPCAC_18835, partial [Pristionchus entomophagus]